MTNPNQIMIAEMIAENAARIAELEEVLARHARSNSLTSHNFVVTMPAIGAMEFDLIDAEDQPGRKRCINPRPVYKTENCQRFEKADAIRVAADCKNGMGETGTAKFWIDACRDDLARLIQLNETLAAL